MLVGLVLAFLRFVLTDEGVMVRDCYEWRHEAPDALGNMTKRHIGGLSFYPANIRASIWAADQDRMARDPACRFTATFFGTEVNISRELTIIGRPCDSNKTFRGSTPEN